MMIHVLNQNVIMAWTMSVWVSGWSITLQQACGILAHESQAPNSVICNSCTGLGSYFYSTALFLKIGNVKHWQTIQVDSAMPHVCIWLDNYHANSVSCRARLSLVTIYAQVGISAFYYHLTGVIDLNCKRNSGHSSSTAPVKWIDGSYITAHWYQIPALQDKIR